MTRKSRKTNNNIQKPIFEPVAIGYVRLSVSGKENTHSIENQKLIIEEWAKQQQIVISHFYVDDGFSGSSYKRPAFQELLKDITNGKVNCVVVKDLSCLGRNLIETGYYIEMFFPTHKVHFVSINDQFDTIDGINNQLGDFKICVPLTNAFHEEVATDIKRKTETALDCKAQRGMFIGARAPFGYKKSEVNSGQIIVDEKAAKIVKKIFKLAIKGTGFTAIVRYLNENNTPTPMQYARANGLTGKYKDGNGNWNTRSVKHILTNPTYTGILIQGKNKRIVENTQEALIDKNTFELIQKNLKSKMSNTKTKSQSTENVLKGKVICGCCGGKMQRKRGTNHADWYFFTCNTNNRIGAGNCTGMYIREQEIFDEIQQQLKLFVKEHFVSDMEYQNKKEELEKEITILSTKYNEEKEKFQQQYELFINKKITEEQFQFSQKDFEKIRIKLKNVETEKLKYEEQYQIFLKLDNASKKELDFNEVVNYIEKICIYQGKKVVVKWAKLF